MHTLTHVQTCDNVRVQNSTEWTASVHTLTFVFKEQNDDEKQKERQSLQSRIGMQGEAAQ